MVTRTPSIVLRTLATGGTFERVVSSPRLVKYAVIQNISTEVVTLTTFDNAALGSGILLNAAGASGQAGGSLEVLPNNTAEDQVDLNIFRYSRTTAGLSLSVYIEE